jgi:YrbI family 3-deoxy-D-manno-octulosonate 8-phosphate phosphatase
MSYLSKMEDIKNRFKKIKLLALDFDGVLTDNMVLTDENGKEAVFCNRSDGLGIEMLKKKGVQVIVISKEKNKVVRARCKKLGIKCFNGIDKKSAIFLREIKKRKLKPEQVCFVGNDVNDIECMKIAGIGVAVADSYKDVFKVADYVTNKKGGKGAVREVADLIL